MLGREKALRGLLRGIGGRVRLPLFLEVENWGAVGGAVRSGGRTLMAEVPHDTTRTVISLLFSGALTRFRDIRFIFTHAGGQYRWYSTG